MFNEQELSCKTKLSTEFLIKTSLRCVCTGNHSCANCVWYCVGPEYHCARVGEGEGIFEECFSNDLNSKLNTVVGSYDAVDLGGCTFVCIYI